MRNKHSLSKEADIYNLLCDIKKEYKNNIKPFLLKNSPRLFDNPHMVPRLKKIVVNRGLGINAQDSGILKKNIEEFQKFTGQKPIITTAKKAIANFKTRKGAALGLSTTLRGNKMYTFFVKLIFFSFSQIRDFHGFSLKSFDRAGNYTIGIKDQQIFPELESDSIDKIQGLTLTIVLDHSLQKKKKNFISKISNSLTLFKMLEFPLNDFGKYNTHRDFSSVIKRWNKKASLKRKRWSIE